jgi:hypothetical protein
MSDLSKYIETRKKTDPAFAEGYNVGYEDFKIGVLIKELRSKRGNAPGRVGKEIAYEEKVSFL